MSDDYQDDPRLREAIREVNAYSSLVTSAGWQLLKAVIDNEITKRRDEIELVPLASLDATLEQEFKKGEIAALRTFLQFPNTQLETAKELIELMTAKEKETEDGE